MATKWLAVALLLWSAPCAAAGLDVNDVVRQVQERYDDTKDFSAKVTQEMTI